jgi:FixJ family two-component response regulator
MGYTIYDTRMTDKDENKPRVRSELIELIHASISGTADNKYQWGFKGFRITGWDGNVYRQFDKEASNVIILEHRVPGINGVEATKNIMAKYPNMRIIIVSSDDGVEKEAIQAKAIRFIKNPISFIDLEKIVNEILCERTHLERSRS